MKRAVGDVRPKGDALARLSLRKAAQGLSGPAVGALGRRTILLILGGGGNCGTPHPRWPDGDAGGEADKTGDAAAPGDSGGGAGAGWTGIATAAAVGGAVVLVAGLALVPVRRRTAKATTRGGA